MEEELNLKHRGVELPPFPWDWVASGVPSNNGKFHAYLVDATGRKLAAIWGKGEEKEAIADFILECVNAAHAVEAVENLLNIKFLDS
jgi:hypothetical protein